MRLIARLGAVLAHLGRAWRYWTRLNYTWRLAWAMSERV